MTGIVDTSRKVTRSDKIYRCVMWGLILLMIALAVLFFKVHSEVERLRGEIKTRYGLDTATESKPVLKENEIPK